MSTDTMKFTCLQIGKGLNSAMLQNRWGKHCSSSNTILPFFLHKRQTKKKFSESHDYPVMTASPQLLPAQQDGSRVTWGISEPVHLKWRSLPYTCLFFPFLWTGLWEDASSILELPWILKMEEQEDRSLRLDNCVTTCACLLRPRASWDRNELLFCLSWFTWPSVLPAKLLTAYYYWF
jgi:hypothetical protein